MHGLKNNLNLWLVLLLLVAKLGALPVFDSLVLESTFENISVLLPFQPNTSRDSIPVRRPYLNRVEYRLEGDVIWKTGHPLACTVVPTIVNSTVTELRYFLGTSLFFLLDNTRYEIRVVLFPNGSDSIVRTGIIATRREGFSSSGRDWYVDSASGDDTLYDGISWSTPKRTIKGAVALRLLPGDKVHIGQGTYFEENVISGLKGTKDNYITFISEQNAKIDGSDQTFLSKNISWELYGHDAHGNSVYRSPLAYEPWALGVEAPESTALNGAFFQYHATNNYCGQSLSDLLADECRLNALGAFYFEPDQDSLYVVIPAGISPSELTWHVSRRVTAFTFNRCEYIHVRGFKIRNAGRFGVRLFNSNFITISSCSFRNVKSAVYTGGIQVPTLSENCVIESCTVSYPKVLAWRSLQMGWSMMHDNEFGDARHHINGFDLSQTGTGTVCRYNRIDSVFNGIYFSKGFDYSALFDSRYLRNMDCYGNTLFTIGDDGFEPEGASMNLRIYKNRLHNITNGFSDAPTTVGPVFFIRNVLSDWGEGAIKSKYTSLSDEAPCFFYHNTCFIHAGRANSVTNSMQDLRDTYKNNIFVGGPNVMEFTQPPFNILLDYNSCYLTSLSTLFYQSAVLACRVPGCQTPYSSGETPDSLLRFEPNGIFNAKARWPKVIDSLHAPYDLHLAEGAVEIDRAEPIPGINDDFQGKGPDMGAFEFGSNDDVEKKSDLNSRLPNLEIISSPYSSMLKIRIFTLQGSRIRLDLFDVNGRCLGQLSEGLYRTGIHEISWDSGKLASAVYWVRLETTGKFLVKPVVICK